MEDKLPGLMTSYAGQRAGGTGVSMSREEKDKVIAVLYAVPVSKDRCRQIVETEIDSLSIYVNARLLREVFPLAEPVGVAAPNLASIFAPGAWPEPLSGAHETGVPRT